MWCDKQRCDVRGVGEPPVAYRIVEIELSEAIPAISISRAEKGVAIVVRRKGRPIGFLMKELAPDSTLDAEAVGRIIRQGIKPALINGERSGGANADGTGQVRSLTVAICTKDNPEDLSNCMNRLLRVRDDAPEGTFEVLVVDNAPSDERTRQLVETLSGVRYIMEPKPGLNCARNRALCEASGEILAFIDDDVIVDRFWVSGLAKAIAEHPDAAAFTGLVLPSELVTEAQILFERNGGFERSFETIRYGQTIPGHPFYPCVGGKFGTGCNMAFRRRVLLDLGGFDEALDTGAALPGGGDTDMFFRVIRAGYPLVYEPQFMVFHRHRREYKQLRRQYCRSWGQGLMAFVFKSYKTDVAQRPNLRRLVFWWFRSCLRNLQKSVMGKHVLPPDMLLAQLWGGIIGLLWAYPRSVKRIDQIRKHNS